MIFGNKRHNVSVEETTNEQPPKQQGFFARTVQGAKDKATQIQQKAQKTADNVRNFKMFLSIVTTLYFIGNSLFWVFNKWGEFGDLLWVMLGVTALYIVVFVITLVKHRDNKKQMSMDNQKFKVQLKLWRTLANLLFIAMSGLSLAQNLMAWRIDGDVGLLVSMLVSGVVLFIKLISTLFKIIKLNKKRKKLNKKQQKLDDKQQQLHGEKE